MEFERLAMQDQIGRIHTVVLFGTLSRVTWVTSLMCFNDCLDIALGQIVTIEFNNQLVIGCRCFDPNHLDYIV